MASRYDYFRIEADGKALWLGATDSLAEAHKLIAQQPSDTRCQYCITGARSAAR